MKRVFCLLFVFTALGMAVPGASVAFAAGTSAPSGQLLTIVPGPGVTLSVDGRAYAGRVVVAEDQGGGLDVVNRVGFEQYVAGIGEVPSNWPAAALQAQAVAARTYALWTVLTHQANAAGGQICASDACQVYLGLAKTDGPNGASWASAVQATSGQVLQYRGQVIEALYGSSDGGQTLYGGVPWLPAVNDPEDNLAPEHSWSWSAPLSTFANLLGVPSGQTLVSLVSSSTAITETLQSASGSQTTVAIAPDDFHSLINQKMDAPAGLDLPLPSYRYSVSTDGQQVRIAGLGDGNGLGMSQYGSLGKAEAGWSASAILGNYYANTTLGALSAGEMPPTIGVTLQSGASTSAIAANGPVTVYSGADVPVASTSGPSGWIASASAGGVTLAPSSGVNFPTSIGGTALTAPVPMRAAPASGSLSTALAGRRPAPTTTTVAATTTTVTAPAPAPRRAVRVAAAVGPPATSPGPSVLGPGLVAILFLASTIGLVVNGRKIFHSVTIKHLGSTLGDHRSGNSLQQ